MPPRSWSATGRRPGGPATISCGTAPDLDTLPGGRSRQRRVWLSSAPALARIVFEMNGEGRNGVTVRPAGHRSQGTVASTAVVRPGSSQRSPGRSVDRRRHPVVGGPVRFLRRTAHPGNETRRDPLFRVERRGGRDEPCRTDRPRSPPQHRSGTGDRTGVKQGTAIAASRSFRSRSTPDELAVSLTLRPLPARRMPGSVDRRIRE